MPTLIESDAAQMRGIGRIHQPECQKLCVAASGFYAQQVVARTLHAPAPIRTAPAMLRAPTGAATRLSQMLGTSPSTVISVRISDRAAHAVELRACSIRGVVS